MNMSKKSVRRRRIFRGQSGWRWKWIFCPATRIGSANLPRGIRGITSWLVHYVSDNWDIDNPAKLSEWKHRDAFEVWTAYFDRLTMAAESKLFEIIGHADLPKKFGHRPTRELHAALQTVPGCRQKIRLRHRTQHRRFAEGLPGNLSRAAKSSSSRFKKACRLLLARTRTRRGSRHEFRRGGSTRAFEVGYSEICRFALRQTFAGEILNRDGRREFHQ